MPAELPLVGRGGAIDRVQDLLATRGGVVFSGPSGVGKTRVATECLLLAEAEGCRTARVGATQAAGAMPFGAFAPLLPSSLTPAADRTELLRYAAGAIAALGDGGRLALLVDDAQFLDDASAALTHQLAASGPVFVVATVRSGVVPPDPVTALWKDELAERIELGPLDDEGVHELLSYMLDGPVDEATVRTFASRSGGNPLFLRELAGAAVDRGAISRHGGVWQLDAALPTSDLLVELLGSRLAELDESDRGVLELLTLGEPLTIDQAAALGVEPSLVGLEARGLVQVGSSGSVGLEVRLGHPLYGDVIRSRLTRLHTRELVRRLADAVESTRGGRADEPLRIALWRLEGGLDVEHGLLLTAARIAQARHDLLLAERLAREAVDAGAGFDGALLVATLASLLGRGEEAEHALAALEPEATSQNRRGLLGVTRVHNLLYGLHQPAAALALAQQTIAALPAGEWRDELAAKEVSLMMHLGRTKDACDRAMPLLSSANPRALVWVASAGAAALARSGRATEALKLAQRGRRSAAALHGPQLWPPIFQVLAVAEVLLFGGRLQEAATTARDGLRQAIEDGSTEERAYLSWYVSETAVAQGLIADAIRYGEEAVRLLRPLNRAPILRFALVPLTSAFALAGRADHADAALAELDALGLPAELGIGPELLVARAWTAVAHADMGRAIALLRDAVGMAADRGDLVPQTVALHDLARLGEAEAVADDLAELAAVVEGDLAQARAAHALALVKGDSAALVAASEQFEACGALLLAAEAAASAGATERASELADKCAPAKTPALTVG